MKKIGVVGTIGGWSSEKLADTVAERTGFRLLVELDKICVDMATGDAYCEGINLRDLDALMIKKAGVYYSPLLMDRLELLRFLSERGLPIFSDPYRIMRVLDRLSCTVTLVNGGIPMPDTTITEDVGCAVEAVQRYGEAIFKPLYTSKARGMTVIKAGPEAREKVEDFGRQFGIMYIQRKMDLGGRDLGVTFLGGEYVTTYARCGNGNSWNTTTRTGGKYRPYEPSPETIELARKAQTLFCLDFTCVDVAETTEGTVVFEVSAFGGFRGIQTASNIDAAALFLDYVMKRI